jgi:putative ABC transport system permease protein
MTRDILQQSWDALRYNRRRATLTMLGMAWGIATVVLLLAYGTGFGQAIHNIFASYGIKSVWIWPNRTTLQAGGAKAGTQVRLTEDDIEKLKQNVPSLADITPEVGKNANVSFEGRSFTWWVRGDYPVLQRILIFEMDEGRFYNPEDLVQKNRVAVLGSEAKEKLFSGRNAVGEYIRVDGVSFQVIGVLKPKMQEGDNDINRVVDVPFTTMKELTDTKYLNGVWLTYETDDFMQIDRTIRTTLAAIHNFNPADKRAVFVNITAKQLDQFNIITMGLKVLLAFIGTLTLGIGGVGLMNIMLVSVQQRTREIGIEKALGATRRNILVQFLAEALAITAVGGILGIIMAYAVSFSVGTLTLYSALAKHGEAGDIRLIISPSTVIIATMILGLVGLISGMLPAIRASRLDPIEALRYE